MLASGRLVLLGLTVLVGRRTLRVRLTAATTIIAVGMGGAAVLLVWRLNHELGADIDAAITGTVQTSSGCTTASLRRGGEVAGAGSAIGVAALERNGHGRTSPCPRAPPDGQHRPRNPRLSPANR